MDIRTCVELRACEVMLYNHSLAGRLGIDASCSRSVLWRCRAVQFRTLSIIIQDIQCYLQCARRHLCLQSRTALIDHPLDQHSANKWDNWPLMSAGQRLQTITSQGVGKITTSMYWLSFIRQLHWHWSGACYLTSCGKLPSLKNAVIWDVPPCGSCKKLRLHSAFVGC
jgi:hypothetical protein